MKSEIDLKKNTKNGKTCKICGKDRKYGLKYCSRECYSIASIGRISGDKNPAKRPDVRKKMSDSMKEKYKNKENHPRYGVHLSIDTKRKISEANKGHLGWNKGLTKETDERLQKLSESLKKRDHWWIRYIGKANKGKHRSLEERKKMSEDRKGEKGSFYGKTHSVETRKKISKMRKGKRNSPATEFKKGEPRTIEIQKKATKKALSHLSERPTKPEQIFLDICKKYNLPFKYVGDGKFWIENINPDFVDCNGRKIAVEIFGGYWHSPIYNSKISYDRTYDGRKKILKKYGWSCIIFWDDELMNDDAEKIVLKRILELHA